MLVSAMSDLHLEFGDIELPGGDILCLAGDTWLAVPMQADKTSKRITALRERFRRFANDELSKYKHVLLVNGNHEHYGMNWCYTSNIIRKFLKKNAKNAVLLDNDACRIGDFIFIGSTLWASYGFPDERQMFLIRERMNDCVSIQTFDEQGYTRPIHPRDIYHEHKRARYRIAYLLKKHLQHPKILITHHAPSFLSKKFSEYNPSDYDWAYYSNFERIFTHKNRIKLAIHGHTHENARYLICETVVTANQRGYVGYEGNAERFDPRTCDITFEELLENEKIIPDERTDDGSGKRTNNTGKHQFNSSDDAQGC